LSKNLQIIPDGQWHYFYDEIRLNENMPSAIVADGPSWGYSTQAGSIYLNGVTWTKIPAGSNIDSGIVSEKWAPGQQSGSYFSNAGNPITGRSFAITSNGNIYTPEIFSRLRFWLSWRCAVSAFIISKATGGNRNAVGRSRIFGLSTI
jgi:hypothetical protein